MSRIIVDKMPTRYDECPFSQMGVCLPFKRDCGTSCKFLIDISMLEQEQRDEAIIDSAIEAIKRNLAIDKALGINYESED